MNSKEAPHKHVAFRDGERNADVCGRASTEGASAFDLENYDKVVPDVRSNGYQVLITRLVNVSHRNQQYCTIK